MKKLVFILAAAAVFAACNNQEKQLESALKISQATSDSLNAVIQDEFAKREKLEKELDELDVYSKGLGVNLSAEQNPEKKKSIIDKIKEASQTLKTQKETIIKLTAKVASLQKKLSDATAENKQLQNRISQLSGENVALKNQVAALTAQNNDLRAKLDCTAVTIQTQGQKLRTGYYVMGGTGYLRDKGVLQRRGLGNAYNPEFNPKVKDFVTKVDISATTEIEVPASKSDVILWSPHVMGTYEVVPKPGDDKKSILRIKDPEEFWQTAKVLAIGTEG
jgi:uncharacterized lipoprotein YajG